MSKRNIAKLTINRQATLMVAFTAASIFHASVSVAQTGYYNQRYTIRAAPPQARVARAVAPANPFPAVYADPPAPLKPRTNSTPKFSALSQTFAASSPKPAIPSGRVQDVFGENRFSDAFNEDPEDPTSRPNPFQKVEPNPIRQNPFGEVRPSEQRNPFGELPDDPSPSTPPMDTRPVRPPQLPPGWEFTPNAGLINPQPPIPGQRDPEFPPQREPERQEPEQREPERRDPEIDDTVVEVPQGNEDPGGLADTEDNDDSVFDRVDPPDDEDLPPVPRPNSSRVYLPAQDPLDYVNSDPGPRGSGRRRVPQGSDSRDFARNPYAGLPGPYGYAGLGGFGAQPGFTPPPGFVPPSGYAVPPGFFPYPVPYLPFGYPATGGLPLPTAQSNQCGCHSNPTLDDNLDLGFPCDPCDVATNGGCGPRPCSNVNRPRLAQTGLGGRIVETGCVEDYVDCGSDAYTEVVACDTVCTNYASAYVSLFGGWSGVNDFITQGDIGQGVFFEDSGGVFGVALGQIQGRNLRTELELSYRNIDINGLRLEGSVPSEFLAVNGDFGTFAGMLNAYWEFVDVGFDRVKPYVGAGVGFALARPELFQGTGDEAAIDNDDSSFAWQLITGLNYKASPTLDAFVEYRYFVAESFSLDTEIPAVAGLGDGSGRFDYQSSNIIFGLRARF